MPLLTAARRADPSPPRANAAATPLVHPARVGPGACAVGPPQVGAVDRRCTCPAPRPAPGRRLSNVGPPFAGRRLMPSCEPQARLGTFRTGGTQVPLPAAAHRGWAPGLAGAARPNAGKPATRTVQPAWGEGAMPQAGAMPPVPASGGAGPEHVFVRFGGGPTARTTRVRADAVLVGSRRSPRGPS